MPPKRRGGQPQAPKSQRLEDMARKKDERAARNAYRKERRAQESYLADDENYGSFANQLAKMALQLRDIPGDGNCLFRALGDQLEGHGRNHMKHRLDVVDFMLSHRADFEPFVEDDVPFDRHVALLKKPGTYAGNDAIVAFARLHKCTVVIHQLNSPCWTIQGIENPNALQLHISYHNGDHYSSVRRMGDKTESPAGISISNAVQKGEPSKSTSSKSSNHIGQTSNHGNHSNGYSTSYYDSFSSGYSSSYDSPLYYSEDAVSYDMGPEFEESHITNSRTSAFNQHDGTEAGMARAIRHTDDVIQNVMRETGCQDASLVETLLEENFYDVDAATACIVQFMATSPSTNGFTSPNGMFPSPSAGSTDSGIWSENGTASRIHGGSLYDSGTMGSINSNGAKPKKQPNVSASRAKRDKKLEKKMRATDRRRQQLLGDGGHPPPDYHDDDYDRDTYHITENMGTLKI